MWQSDIHGVERNMSPLFLPKSFHCEGVWADVCDIVFPKKKKKTGIKVGYDALQDDLKEFVYVIECSIKWQTRACLVRVNLIMIPLVRSTVRPSR